MQRAVMSGSPACGSEGLAAGWCWLVLAGASKRSIRRFVSKGHKGRAGLVSIVSYSRPSLMIIASLTQFHVYLLWDQRLFSIVS